MSSKPEYIRPVKLHTFKQFSPRTDETLRRQIRRWITDNGGRFASVTFVKADGTIRTMNVRHASLRRYVTEDRARRNLSATDVDALNIKAHARALANPDVLVTFDHVAQAPRSIDLRRVVSVSVDGYRLDFSEVA